MQRTTETRPSEISPSTPAVLAASNVRAAAVHAAQSKLLLRRAAADTIDPRQVRALHDLSGILQHVLNAIDHLATSRTPSAELEIDELGRTA